MKRIYLLFVLLMVIFATVAQASIFGRIFDGGIEAAVALAVSGIFFILGLFIKKAMNWRAASVEGTQVVMAIYRSTRPNSPGGVKLTQEEIEKIILETKQFGAAFSKAYQETYGKTLIPQ
jgi:hypothetical protein